MKLDAQLASRWACFQGKRFYGISRDFLCWPSLEIQIREIHLWHSQDLLKLGLVVDWGQSETPEVQGLCQSSYNFWFFYLASKTQRQSLEQCWLTLDLRDSWLFCIWISNEGAGSSIQCMSLWERQRKAGCHNLSAISYVYIGNKIGYSVCGIL